jgi:hypothetical protein
LRRRRCPLLLLTAMHTRILLFSSFFMLGLLADARAQAPANDSIASAISFDRSTNQTVDNTEATAEAGEPAHGSSSSGARRSVWFRTTPAFGGFYLFDITASAAPQTELAIYRGTKIGGLTLTKRTNSTALVELVKGVTYSIALDSSGPGNVNMKCLDKFLVTSPLTLETALPDPDSNLDWAPSEYGKLAITLAAGGALSGVLELGQGTHRFASRVLPGGTIVEIPRVNLPAVRLNIMAREFFGSVYGLDVDYQPDVTEARSTLVSMNARTTAYSSDFVGTYNMLDLERNDRNIPMSVGHGLTIGSFQVTAKGTALGTVILSDGETATFSGMVSTSTGALQLGQGTLKVMLHKSLYRKGGQISGKIHLQRTNPNAPSYRANIMWARETVDPKRKLHHRTAAREMIALHVERYQPPAAGSRIWDAQFQPPVGDGCNLVWQSLDHGMQWLAPLKMSVKNVLSLPQPSQRLLRFSGKATAANSFVAGSFTDARPPQPGPVIPVTFRAFYFPSLIYAVGITTEKDGTSYMAIAP